MNNPTTYFAVKTYDSVQLTDLHEAKDIASFANESGIRDIIIVEYSREFHRSPSQPQQTVQAPETIASLPQLVEFFSQGKMHNVTREQVKEIFAACKSHLGIVFTVESSHPIVQDIYITNSKLNVQVASNYFAKVKDDTDQVTTPKYRFFLDSWRQEIAQFDISSQFCPDVDETVRRVEDLVKNRRAALGKLYLALLGYFITEDFLLSPKVYPVERVVLEQFGGYDNADTALDLPGDKDFRVLFTDLCNPTMRPYVFSAIQNIVQELYDDDRVLENERLFYYRGKSDDKLAREVFEVAKSSHELEVKTRRVVDYLIQEGDTRVFDPHSYYPEFEDDPDDVGH